MTAPLCYNCGRPRATQADWEHGQGCACERCLAVCWSHLHCSTRERLAEIIDEAFGMQPPAETTGELLASLDRLLRKQGTALREALAERDRLREQVRRVEDALSDNGCECPCDHHPDERGPDCEVCLACRIGKALGK